MMLGAAILAAVAAAPADTGPAGRTVFVEHKCQRCHAVAAAGLAGGPEDGPDLSNVGASHTPDWLRRYLRKEEAKAGKKHKKRFQGTEAELAALVAWLASLK